jgi:hypothetical protein
MDQVTKQDVIEVAAALGLEHVPTNELKAELVRREINQRAKELYQLKQALEQLRGQPQQETK